jgi:hypothetical protein
MKLDVFKKLIKEAVKEAVREELEIILSEDVKNTSTTPVVEHITPQSTYRPPVANPVKTGDPIMDILNETRASMTQESYRDLVNATSDMVQAPGLGMNPIESFQAGPAPGLDLSTLSFAKNAGAIYKASVEKDKARFGA